MFYGFVITEIGNRLLAKMVAGQTLEITRVVMDRGTAGTPETARKLTTPIDPGPQGTSTAPTVDGNTVHIIAEYRSDLNGGLAEGFWIGGFAIYAKDPDGGDDIMLYYGSLGDAKQFVSAYTKGTAPDVRRYPVSITVTSGVEVSVSYPAEAWMTAEDVAKFFDETLGPGLETSLTVLVTDHDADQDAHGDLRALVQENAEATAKAQETADAALAAGGSSQETANTALQTAKEAKQDAVAALEAAGNAQTTAAVALEAVTRLANTIEITPSQNGSLTYTGGVQTPGWNSFNQGMMTIGGVTSGTNAGTYTATFTPNEGYTWEDGSITARAVTWSIGKAAGSLGLSKTSLSLTNGSLTDTVTVTRAGDGAISAASSNSAVATVSVSGATVTVTGVAFGDATITVSVAAGSNHNAPASKTCGVAATIYNTTLELNSWARIAAAVANGNVPSTWAIGSEKNIALTTGETLTVQIYGKNHDDLAGGGKAALTFGLKNLMAANQQMNAANTNVGGFTGSALYTWLQGTLYNSLPADLRAAIKSVNKKTSAGNNSSTINSNAMKIFLFSEVECFGSTTYSAAGEGAQYPIFTDNTSRIKKQSNGAGSANSWWERSPYATNANGFCTVYSNGNAGTSNANNSYGVCFGFCI